MYTHQSSRQTPGRRAFVLTCVALLFGLFHVGLCHADQPNQPPKTTKSTKKAKKRISQRTPPGADSQRGDDVDLSQYDRRRYRRYRRGGRPMYYRTVNPRRGFLIAGIVLTSVGYGLSLLVGLSGYSVASAVGDGNTALDFGMLMVPVAGPFVTWALVAGRFASNPNQYSGAPITYPWLAILGLAQGLGVAFIILGATGKRRRAPVYGAVPRQEAIATTTPPPPAPVKAQVLGQFGLH